MWTIIRKKATQKSTILELGCGTGYNIQKARDTGIPFRHYTGFDFSEDMLKQAQEKFSGEKKVKVLQKDITLKPGKEKYDIILSTWVFSHLETPSDVANAYARQLKRGGTMFLLFLTRPAWYIHFWFYPLLRLFAADYVREEEVAAMQNKKRVVKVIGGLGTLVEIK
ncbi:class I SAM-dependent methyltransferase [Candidatus Woesearchaeota archaeon]|nr:class I SAM-dependent methyltransferase [Candidatus Woesearchaeota archaeon]